MRLKIADYFTIGNFASGFFAIIYSIIGQHTPSAILMLAAVLFDFVDGRIARHLKQQNDFGKQLDSLADLTSFGIAPAVFGYCLGLQSTLDVFALAFFATCGMLRLARFNVTSVKHFEGVPITTNGYLFPLLFFAIGDFGWYIILGYVIMGLLMVSRIRIKKW
jgi:CDP-diacylglycerol--serine O-phosphatidyltransferase